MIWAGRPVVGAVLSISEWGCLFQTCADVGVDAALDFQLALPGSGLFTSRARCVHQRAGIGLEFGSPPSAMRDTIGDYVYHHLAAAAA